MFSEISSASEASHEVLQHGMKARAFKTLAADTHLPCQLSNHPFQHMLAYRVCSSMIEL